MKTSVITKMALGAVTVLLVAGGVANAKPFNHPPELTDPNWVTPLPYQRNIMVGFDTNPHDWPAHTANPEAKALTPSVVHHQGTDDDQLWPSDWLAGDMQPAGGGSTAWLAEDTVTGTDRKGILALNGNAGTTFTLVWHIDNWDRPKEEKHFFVEAEYYTTGNLGADQLTSSSGLVVLLDPHYENLPNGWIRWWSWATLTPNPEWEEMVNSVTFEKDGVLLLDYMHIATECVPEPATLGLLALGGLALLKRNRKS